MKHVVVIYFNGMLACVAWWFWLGAQSNKGGLGQRNLKEIGTASTILHARSARGFLVFLATPLVRLAGQNRCRLIKTKFASEFVRTDKPTKFVSCWFVGSCQLNSCLNKSKFVSKFVGTDKPTKFDSCRFVSSCQLNPCLIKSKVVSEFVGTDKPTEILHSFAEMSICKG